MSQTICELETEGLTERRLQQRDGRCTRIALTVRGRAALDLDRAARESRLRQEIGAFAPAEHEALSEAVGLLSRLADAG